MSAWKSMSTSAALVTLAVGAVAACTSDGGGGSVPSLPGTGYQVPTTPFEPSGGQEQPTSPYQPPGTPPGGSSGGGGGGSCSYCGQTYTCSAVVDGQTEGSSTVTLPPADGDACTIADDAGSASFSCDGTISYDGSSVSWAPTGSGGFTYTISSESTTTGTGTGGTTGNPITTTTTAIVTCTPGSSSGNNSSSGATPITGEDAG